MQAHFCLLWIWQVLVMETLKRCCRVPFILNSKMGRRMLQQCNSCTDGASVICVLLTPVCVPFSCFPCCTVLLGDTILVSSPLPAYTCCLLVRSKECLFVKCLYSSWCSVGTSGRYSQGEVYLRSLPWYLRLPQGSLNAGMCSELVSGDIGLSQGNLKRLICLA